MYVLGTLRSNDSVIVEIGTGYYVRKVCGIHDYHGFSNDWMLSIT